MPWLIKVAASFYSFNVFIHLVWILNWLTHGRQSGGRKGVFLSVGL